MRPRGSPCARRRRRAGPSKPLHIVGFSNGGALAMKYALDALDDKQLARPDRLILISPMIGITSFARFRRDCRVAGAAARLRQGGVARHRARVQSVQVQFLSGQRRAPVVPPDGRPAGSRCARRAATACSIACRRPDLPVRRRLHGEHAGDHFRRSMPSCRRTAASSSCSTSIAPPCSGRFCAAPPRPSCRASWPRPPRNFRTAIITNAAADTYEVVERVTEAGALTEQTRELGLAFPSASFRCRMSLCRFR